MRSIVCLLFLLTAVPAAAETVVLGELPRRAWLGVGFGAGPEGLPAITTVVPDGPAAAAGVRSGDVLAGVDDTELGAPGALSGALTGQRAGDVVVFHVRRGPEELALPVTLGAAPMEEAEDLELLYDIVELPGARLRSIVSRPLGAEGRLPAVLFVQGLTCGSVEQPFGPPNTVTQLIRGLTRAGFAVMRCEKSGVGDSEGEPCSEIGFHREVEGFHAALLALKEYDFVDPDNVFIFGHSMGGIQGPMVAVQEPVRGVMVYGTGVLSWGEYLIENTRRQARLDPTTDLAELESEMRDRERFYHYLFREGMEVPAIAAAHPDLAEIGTEDFPDGTHGYTRHVQFFRELDAVNMAGVWQEMPAPALALYGEYDFATSRAEHDYIVEIVNRVRPGTAEVVEFPGLFHGFNRRASMEETLANPWAGEFGEEVLTTCVEWMNGVMEGAVAAAP